MKESAKGRFFEKKKKSSPFLSTDIVSSNLIFFFLPLFLLTLYPPDSYGAPAAAPVSIDSYGSPAAPPRNAINPRNPGI